jgi:hypothetical protein
MNENNELQEPDSLSTLKAIHTEQQKQSKFLKNIYQIQVILFTIGVIVFVIGFAWYQNASRF